MGREPGDSTLIDSLQLRSDLESKAPTLWRELGALADQWTADALKRLEAGRSHAAYPKTFNDPIWGVVEFLPWETVLLDSPLLQRLRGVRQLGMAHLVYPGAGHDRLEHSRGVVEAAERMIRALERNADHRRRFGSDRDELVPSVNEQDRYATRLAALLHDVGHGPFSHATEQLVEARHKNEFQGAASVLRGTFEGVTSIAAAEVIAVVIVLSDAMNKILTHQALGTGVPKPAELPLAIAARILGSRSCLKAGYLSGIISGPVDADKLDYVARDCYHSGLPLGIDLTRLISKLEVVAVTPENAPNQELRDRAEQSQEKRFYDIGISQTGLGSYEQLIIARVLLYDRLYYHQKVRGAESMLQCLICLAEEESGSKYSIKEFFSSVSDDIFIGIIGGELKSSALKCGGIGSSRVARLIKDRRIYYRAYAFAARFIAGLDKLPNKERRDTRALLWRKLLRELSSDEGCRTTAEKIYKKAIELASNIPDLAQYAIDIKQEEILVDLPFNKVVVRGGDILTRTDGGHIGTPNLFFDPERWSQAYEHQKQCGFVFTPRNRVALVALASRIVFFETFGLVMDEQADRAAKVTGIVRDTWVTSARDKGLCSPESAEVLQGDLPRLVLFRGDDLTLPQDWLSEDPDVRNRIAEELNSHLPAGLPASFHKAVLDTIRNLTSFVNMIEKTGSWTSRQELSESQLQEKLHEHLLSREVPVVEGSKLGGGETDLVLHDLIVVENKVCKKTQDPFKVGPHAAWQARRYSVALCSRVAFVVVGYRPSDEAALLPLPSRIRARAMPESPEKRCEVRVVVPWGAGIPSSAKNPTGSNRASMR